MTFYIRSTVHINKQRESMNNLLSGLVDNMVVCFALFSFCFVLYSFSFFVEVSSAEITTGNGIDPSTVFVEMI